MIEKTPIFNVTKETFDLLLDNDLKPLFNKINTEYLYWDKVKGNGRKVAIDVRCKREDVRWIKKRVG